MIRYKKVQYLLYEEIADQDNCFCLDFGMWASTVRTHQTFSFQKMGSASIYLCMFLTLATGTFFPVIMIFFGVMKIHDCPLNPLIPKFMIVTGATGLITTFLYLLAYIFQRNINNSLLVFTSMLIAMTTLFTIIWNIVGSVWVFQQWNYWNDQTLGRCHTESFMIAFTYLIIYWITCPCQMKMIGNNSMFNENQDDVWILLWNSRGSRGVVGVLPLNVIQVWSPLLGKFSQLSPFVLSLPTRSFWNFSHSVLVISHISPSRKRPSKIEY